MEPEIKFTDIKKFAKVRTPSLQYTLKALDQFPGMPASGGQGSHRIFTVRQAITISMTTHLVMAGVQLPKAIQAVIECEQNAKVLQKLEGIETGFSYLVKEQEENWYLQMFDAQYVNLWKEGIKFKDSTGDLPKHHPQDEYFNVISKEWNTDYYAEEQSIVCFNLDVTWLEIQFLDGIT